MERIQDELKAHLITTDDEFRRLAQDHANYERQIEAIEAKPRVTDLDEIEEHRLKKLKLRIKDQMTEIMARHRAAHVA